MVTLGEYNGFKDCVFVDGRRLIKQCLGYPIIKNGIIKVKVLYDTRLDECEDVQNLPYQVFPPIIKTQTRDDVGVATLFLKYGGEHEELV